MIAKLVYTGVVFMGFLAIMNPLSGVSIFLNLTKKFEDAEVRRTAKIAVITAFAIVVVFSIAGHFLLSFFGVSFTALRIAGGILVGLIGYEMLQAKQSSYSNPSSEIPSASGAEESSIAVTPLGVPLLAGPGVIVTAMNFATGSYLNLIATIFAFGALCVITYFVFVGGKQIKALLGANILSVIMRMMGLILIVIGTQMLIEGVYGAINEFQMIKYF